MAENWHVFLAAGSWFLLAAVVGLLSVVSFADSFLSVVDLLSVDVFSYAFGWTGVCVVLVYVVASLSDVRPADRAA